MFFSRCFFSFINSSFANSHLSGSIFLKPCIQLSNEAGEIIMLKIRRQQVSSKLRRIPHDKTVAFCAPRHNFIRH
ncbi:hypothetical protein Hanom_Chr11g01041811 [Helianthus anomalus]